MDYVASLGCVVCKRPAQIHHIQHMNGKSMKRDHRYVVGLCMEHHTGSNGIHGLGHEDIFNEIYGIDLVEEAVRLWNERDC